MAKRPSKHLRPARPLLGGGFQRLEQSAAGDFVVRSVPASQALKEYRCPGCQQRVAVGTAHVVAWPVTAPLGEDSGLAVRRHWHAHCWRSRR